MTAIPGAWPFAHDSNRWSPVLAVLLLGGCIEAEMKSEFDNDGSAVHSYTLQLEKDQMDLLGGLGGGDVDEQLNFEEAVAQAQQLGLDAEGIEKAQRGLHRLPRSGRRSRTTRDIGAVYNEIFEASATDGPAPTDAVVGSYTRDGDDWVLNLTVDSDVMFNSSGLEEQGQWAEDAEDFITFTYVAVMPGEIRETQGEEIGDNTVQWELPVSGQDTDLRAVSAGGGSDGSGHQQHHYPDRAGGPAESSARCWRSGYSRSVAPNTGHRRRSHQRRPSHRRPRSHPARSTPRPCRRPLAQPVWLPTRRRSNQHQPFRSPTAQASSTSRPTRCPPRHPPPT